MYKCFSLFLIIYIVNFVGSLIFSAYFEEDFVTANFVGAAIASLAASIVFFEKFQRNFDGSEYKWLFRAMVLVAIGMELLFVVLPEIYHSFAVLPVVAFALIRIGLQALIFYFVLKGAWKIFMLDKK